MKTNKQLTLAALSIGLIGCAETPPPYTPPQTTQAIMSPECAEEYKFTTPMTSANSVAERLSTARTEKQRRGILHPEDTGSGVNILFVSGQDKAVFPKCAIENGIAGKCDVALDLAKDGSARNLEAICSHPMFEAYAIQMVSSTTFKPVTSSGKPVNYPGILYPLEYAFEN